MAKTVDEQTRFIELRAKGHSYDKIAQEIDTSKPVLLKWQKEFSEQISELKLFHFESLAEQFSLMKRQRLEYLGILYQKVKTELQKRDFTKVSTEKLIEIFDRLQGKIIAELDVIETRISQDGEAKQLELKSETEFMSKTIGELDPEDRRKLYNILEHNGRC